VLDWRQTATDPRPSLAISHESGIKLSLIAPYQFLSRLHYWRF